jgi:cell division protein FtsL
MSNVAYNVQQQPRQHQVKQNEVERQAIPSKVLKRGVTKGEKFLWTIALIGLLCASVFVISNYASIYAVNSDIQQVETKIDRQQKVNGNLELQVSELSAPERIITIAKERIGLTSNISNVKVVEN